MQKVLITGAGGFIGKALTKYLLANNIHVYAIVRNSKKIEDLAENSNLTIVSCDMADYKTLPNIITEREFDACFHFAWQGAMGPDIQNLPIQLKNITDTDALVLALSQLKTKKLIFADTMHIYKYTPITDSQRKNSDVYGLVKFLVREYSRQQTSRMGMQFNSVIMANVFGVGDQSKRSTNIIIGKLLKGESPSLADGSILYDWTYIDDVIQAIMAVLEKGTPYKTYYLGHRKLRTFKDIITNVRDVVNPNVSLSFGTFQDTSFIDYDRFFNDDLYCDTGFEMISDFKENIKKTTEWVKNLGF